MSKIVALPHAAKRSSSDFPMNALGILAASHLHISPIMIRVGEQIRYTDLFAAIGLSNGVLDHVGFAADVVLGSR